MPTVNTSPQQPPQQQGSWTAPVPGAQQPYPQQGAWTAPNEQPRKKKRTGCLVAVAIVAFLALIAVVQFIQAVTKSTAPEPFAVGQCLTMDLDAMEYERVDCSDPAAQQKVLGVRRPDWFRDCLDIDGSQSGPETSEPEHVTLCTGPVNGDPTMSVNNITAGECLIPAIPPEHPRRADCAEPGAMRVDGRLDEADPPNDPHSPAPETLCANAGYPQSEAILHFGIKGQIDGRLESYYRVACLSQP